MEIKVPTRTINRTLIVTIALLTTAGLIAEAARCFWASQSEAVNYFSLSEECNFPTWFSSMILLADSFILAWIAATKGPAKSEFRRYWIGLSIIFLYISIDELVQIHEQLNSLKALKGHHGVLYFGWLIPAGILVTIFALSYLKFLFHLPMKTRIKVAAAGFIYVGGAAGVELILGAWTDKHGEDNFVYALIDIVEETMEMAGASLFFSSLLEYLGDQVPDLRVVIRPGRPSDRA
jgi:hypothetical protein